jgi:A/G-specific adenine glycosylase
MNNEAFRQIIYDYYQNHKRNLPWRETTDPYRIMVSEIMLQQTQVPRVIEKYLAWMERFPTIETLAAASLGEVLVLWSGLGYNRRAKFLWQASQKIVADFNGLVPSATDDLITLPGIGGYTAAAIRTFAFNLPAVVVETNIRAVYIHFFFKDQEKVADELLIPLIETTMDQDHPREWFNALMDYGTKLKASIENPTRRSKQYSKQSRFEGSNRQIRGAVLTALAQGKDLAELRWNPERITAVLSDLIQEGLIKETATGYTLP